ncbi:MULTISPECIES: extracellular solute-binding protein [unclassified Agarivorans]|uniref:extracellular solute-binding protein n=1 Tax=unclassified Agarivorans TaxID=2636026 RepID=UPI003D7E5B9E
MTKKKLLVSALFGLGLACTANAAQTEIRFDGFPDFDSSLKQILPKFYQENPDLKVDYVMNNWGDHHNKLTTNLATGSGAGDVVVVDVGRIGAFVNKGGFVNLSEKYDVDSLADQYAPYAWTQGQGVDGAQYGIPVDLGPGVLYYRRDVADSVGADINKVIHDWDSYIEYGKKLKPKGVYLIASAADVAEAIIYTTVEDGNGLYFDAQGKSLLQSPRFVKAFETAKKIRDLGLDAKITAWSNEWYEGFKQGTLATQLSGAWLLGHLKNWMAPDTAGKWGVSNLPDGIYGSWGGSFLVIPKQSNKQDQAWTLIKYMATRPDVELEAFKTIAAFPSLVATYDDPMFDEKIDFLNGQKARLLFAEVAKNVKPVKPAKGDQVARSIILDAALGEVLDEGKDVKTALAEADRILQRRLKAM